MTGRGLFGLPLLALTLLGACDHDLERRLAAALQSSVTAVRIDGTEVIASCRGGGAATAPVSELQLDWLGLSALEHQAKVAEALHRQCAASLRTRAEQKRAEAEVRERAEELGLPTAEASDEVLRARICDAYIAQLPTDPAARAIVVEDHAKRYGCTASVEDPPVSPDPPAEEESRGAWTSREEPGRTPRVTLSLVGADDRHGAAYTLQLSCQVRGGPTLMVSAPRKLRKGRPWLELDGKRTRIRGKVARNSRAVVFSDGARALRLLLEAKELQLSLPTAPSGKARFLLAGLREAISPYAALCGLRAEPEGP